ncbi:MAG: zinc-dependent metalloprotease [Candidatus Limnocylindrales bacterium]
MTAATRRRGRSWQVSLALGAALGIAAAIASRRAERAVSDGGLVDWSRAEGIAVKRLGRAPGALSAAELSASRPDYAAAMTRIVPLLEARLGQPLPGVVERWDVVDRAGWARANLVTFKHIFGRVEETLRERLMRNSRGPVTPGIATLANRFIATQQIGFLVGFLGGRVLGQYDVALLSAESRPGRLLFVEENIRATAAALGVPLRDFRIWICLHETTHAFELEAHPWLRPYLADRLERQLAAFVEETRTLQLEGILQALRRWRDSSGEPLAGLLSPEQRRLLRETQLVMSLLEGFSDWVMDEVGSQLIADVHGVRERFEARRNQRRRGLERIVARLTGLDMKLEQYRRGERFVSGVAAAGGREAVAHLWDGPDSLPTEAEMADPVSWVRRIAPATLAQPA